MSRSWLRLSLAVLMICALTAALRLPALLHPEPIDDENIYAVVANEILHGGRPYVDAVERKPPLLFWTYAAIFDIGGMFNWRALHVAALLWTLATMLGLYAMTRSVLDGNAGLLAAVFYGVFQPWATWKNLAFNGELLMNLPIVWAWAIAFAPGWRFRATRPELFVAGVLSCAAFLLKQPAAIAAVPLAAYFLLPSYRASRRLTLGQSCVQVAWFAGGFTVALAAVAALLRHQGILREAFYWTISDHDVPLIFWAHGLAITLGFVGACLPLIFGASLALARDELWTARRAERAALIGLLSVSVLGAAASGRFYPHYYIQLLPPLVVLAAVYYRRAWTDSSVRLHWAPPRSAIFAWIALTAVAFFVAHWIGLAPQEQPTAAGRYLAEHSSPDDRIFVWGQVPQVYLDARRRPASRYISTFPLTGFIFGGPAGRRDTSDRIVPGAWDTLEADFARHPPTFIVDVESNADARYPVGRFPMLARLLTEHFEPVAHTTEGVVYRRRN